MRKVKYLWDNARLFKSKKAGWSSRMSLLHSLLLSIAHKGHYAGTKIVLICSISKKKLKKALFLIIYLDMLGNMAIFAHCYNLRI